MTRKAPITFIDYTESEDPELNYCPNCERVKIKSKLGPRIYEEDKPLPYDYDQWLQCYRCGKIIHISLARGEPAYGPAVEPPTEPYDQTGSNFESVDKRSKKKRVSRDKLHQYDDPDISLEKGDVTLHQ